MSFSLDIIRWSVGFVSFGRWRRSLGWIRNQRFETLSWMCGFKFHKENLSHYFCFVSFHYNCNSRFTRSSSQTKSLFWNTVRRITPCFWHKTYVTVYFLDISKPRSFYQQIGLKFEEETSKMLHLEHGFIWCWNLDASGSRSEIPGKFWNVVLEKDGEDQLDRSCEK